MRITEQHLRKIIKEELVLGQLGRRLLREMFEPEETAKDILRVIKSTGGNLARAADQIEMMVDTTGKGYDTEELRALYRPLFNGARKLGIDVDAKKAEMKKILLALRNN